MPLFFRIFNCRNLKLRFVSRLKSPKAAIVRFVSCTNFLHKENSISFRKRKLECMTHVVAQIGEQMCLETNFQYEFSFLVRFGQSGLQRKNPNCLKYATFEAKAEIPLEGIFFPMKTGIKSSILTAVWIFFSLQPRLPKTAQEWKFILEICLKTHLFSNLWMKLLRAEMPLDKLMASVTVGTK